MTVRAVAIVTPFLLAVPVLFGASFIVAGYPLLLGPLLAGAAGWAVALFLRAPIGLVGARMLGSAERTSRIVVLSSGPLEEGVRLIVVLVVGRDLGSALWIGLGWAAIEVAYSVVNGLVIASMTERNDPEMERVRALLPPAALSPSAPWWGIVERVFATMLHIGFTLIVAAQPVLVLVTAVVHSATNVLFVRLARSRPMWLLMTGGLMLGALILTIGLVMHASL